MQGRSAEARFHRDKLEGVKILREQRERSWPMHLASGDSDAGSVRYGAKGAEIVLSTNGAR